MQVRVCYERQHIHSPKGLILLDRHRRIFLHRRERLCVSVCSPYCCGGGIESVNLALLCRDPCCLDQDTDHRVCLSLLVLFLRQHQTRASKAVGRPECPKGYNRYFPSNPPAD